MGKVRKSKTIGRDEAEASSSYHGYEDADTSSTCLVPAKKRKLHTYEKAKLAFERVQNDRIAKQKDRERRQEEKVSALKAYKKDKKNKAKFLLYQKTKRGQPKLGLQMEYLLGKIKKQISGESEDKKKLL